jgi:hypothetical protein
MRASRQRKWQIRAGDKARAKAAARMAAKTAARIAAQAEKAAAQAGDDDAPPRDIEAIRDELAGNIFALIGAELGYWRGCPERVCRRARACRAPRGDCSGAPPLPPMTEEQQEQAMAGVRQALTAALRERCDDDRSQERSNP